MAKMYDIHVHVPVETDGPGKKVEELVEKYAKLETFGQYSRAGFTHGHR